jgi:two-component system NarL family sensor kinase
LLNPANPIYISLFIIIILFSVIYFLYKYLINPLISKFHKEKEKIELKSAKLMTLFAQLDPDPLIRIDSNGTIIETNKAAQKVSSLPELRGKKINDILPFIHFIPGVSIKEEQSKVFTYEVNRRFYSVLFRSEPGLEIAQIYFHDITDLKSYEKKLIESQHKLRGLSDHLQDLIEQERHSIARGLHDGIGQSLSMLRMRIIRMSELDNNPERTEIRRGVVDTLEEIILDLKKISNNLKPRMLEEMGLGFALKYLVDKVVVETGLVGEINVIGEEIRLESKLEIYLYRIVQEAITNIMKYANASNFSIQLVITDKFLRMIISDNGKGFNLEEVSSRNNSLNGMGLLNMRERVEAYQGQLKIDSSDGNGTMIVIEIPLEKELVWQNQKQYVY